jgi:hypothetical protein
MIARVFPRRTHATPRDPYAFIGDPGLFIPDDVTEVHVSVTFTWDLPEAARLADAWSRIAPVTIGGPATGMRGEEFVPGRYVREGYVITSRGCPNHCFFCSVPKREGKLRELPVRDGWNLLDDNILACSDAHLANVFVMLERQKAQGHRIEFTGGLEAKRLKPWHVDALKHLRPKQIFFAYDTPDDLPPLEEASRLFREARYGTRSILRCYVLVGYQGDTFQAAEERLRTAMRLGFCPMAMLYRDEQGKTTAEWRRFQRAWARPAVIYRSGMEAQR